jgi:apolipoprotein N-acyltransferase
MATIFQVSNLLALPFWLLMIVFPHWRWTRRIMRSPLVVVPLAAIYAGLALPRLVELVPALSNPTLPGVAALLGRPDGATIGWVHFLAFDLFVGRWAYLDSRDRALSAWLMVPVLLLILLLGPVGLLLYLGLRAGVRSRGTQPNRTIAAEGGAR